MMKLRTLPRRLMPAMLLLAAAAQPVAAQQVNRDSVRAAIERGMAMSDWAAIDRAIVTLRVATQAATGRSDAWWQYDLAYALHRRASGLLVENRGGAAKDLLEEAVVAAGRSRTLGGGGAAQALEGGVTGQLASATGGLAMMRLGRSSLRLLDEAVAAAPTDPRVALMNGITRVNAPAFAGGGAARGEAELRRAVALFASDRSVSPQPTWGRVDAHIWLAIALEKQDKMAEARAELARALELTPGHRWVVETLQPQFARRR
jgi:tetratricopeptide (TPR) repeat protein